MKDKMIRYALCLVLYALCLWIAIEYSQPIEKKLSDSAVVETKSGKELLVPN